MKLNKIITAFGAALLALTSLSPLAVSADQLQSAEDVLQDGSFEYESVNGGYKITKCTATMITEIPAIRNGVPIIEIGERAFAGFTGISELVLPDSITTIGEMPRLSFSPKSSSPSAKEPLRAAPASQSSKYRILLPRYL